MRILVPMAGYGTRLRPHTWSKPKPLVSVAGKTVLGHVLDGIATVPDVDEVVFIVGYLGQQVAEYVSQHYPHLQARYVEQAELLGQSHAVWLAREYVSGPLLILFVDTLIETDYAFLKHESADAVAWVKAVPDPRRFGVAELRPDRTVSRLIEKPEDMANNLVVVGCYYFRDGVHLLRAIETQMAGQERPKGEYFLADAINHMLDAGLRMRIEAVEVWQDCGKPDALLETNRYLLDSGRDNTAKARTREGVVVVPPVYIDPTALVADSVIGPHVSIGAGCEVRRSLVRDSIIDDGSQILDTALSASIIGREARVVGRYRALNVGDSSEIDFA